MKKLIEELKSIVAKCDITPEYDSSDYKTGYLNSDTLTEIRETIQDIVDRLTNEKGTKIISKEIKNETTTTKTGNGN